MTYENPNITLIDISGNALSAAPGSAVPTSGLAIVGSDGTNARFLSTDTSGRLIVISNATDNTTNVTTKLPVIVAVANTAAPTYTSGNMVPLSVDTSGNLRITGSISATNPSVSTTGSAPPASATYIGGSVTTAAPTYTTGQLNALSLTTAGALRIDGSAVTQPVSGTITANAGTGSFTVAQATAANLNATVVGSGNFTVVQPTAANLNATVTGTVTANQGGAPWSQNITQFGGSAVVTGTGASGAGIPRVTVSNDSNIAATQSGTWVVSATQATATNLNALVSQGPQAVLANAWPIKITDATNGPVAIKAASTVAAATDQSLVVALSPNSHVKATVSPLFTGSANTLTATLASLATGSARSSAAVNNTSNLYEDVLIFVTITPPTTCVSGTGYVNVFGYGSLDGTNFPESGVGTDAAATISSPANLPLLAQITVNANSGTRASFKYGPFSFCRTFGLDRLPPYWGVVVQNNCGAALAASGQSITYLPVNGQLV